MTNYKYLFKNIGFLTLSNFATRLLSFFLVPLYTNVLSTSEYGIYDLLNNTVGILVPVLSLNIMESVLRFSLENEDSRSKIFLIGLKYFLTGTEIVLFFLLLNRLIQVFPVFDQYAFYFLLMFISQVLSGNLTAYARGAERIADLSVSSVIASVTMIFLNIFFLLVLRIGIHGYFLANIMGSIFQCIYLIIKIRPKFYRYRDTDKNLEKAMLHYSIPLIFNSIAFWVNSASDRYVVTWFCGLDANGIYSVASKIPSILNVFQVIFTQAWTLSAVKDFDPDDKNGFFSNTYRAYQAFITIGCSAIILFNRILARFLYANEFYSAWRYVPWLTIAIVFSSITGYIGGIFSAVKESAAFAKSMLIGAGINLVLNIVFTPFIGPLAAAIATAISNYIVLIIRIYQVKRYIRLTFSPARDNFSYVLLGVQGILFLVFTDTILLYVLLFLLEGILLVLYKKEIKEISNKICRIIKLVRANERDVNSNQTV